MRILPYLLKLLRIQKLLKNLLIDNILLLNLELKLLIQVLSLNDQEQDEETKGFSHLKRMTRIKDVSINHVAFKEASNSEFEFKNSTTTDEQKPTPPALIEEGASYCR